MTFGSIAVADSGGWGHMWGSYGGMLFGWLFMTLLAVAAVWLVVRLARGSEVRGDRKDPMDILDARYARGEIDRDEYLQRRADIDR